MAIMGAPGAGKGTQAKRISDAYGVPHISTGDIFRDHIDRKTPLGLEIKHCLAEGHLAPDATACRIVAERLAETDCKSGFILDGFPRSLNQAECLERLLKERNEKLDLVLSLTVSEEEIVSRLTARRMCPNCGAIYSLAFDPPPDNRCQEPPCNGEPLVQRTDDEEETVRERLRIYHAKTEPILEFFERSKTLKRVPGNDAGPDAVFEKIESIINACGVACES